MPALHSSGAAARQSLRHEQIAAANQAYKVGIDPEVLRTWTWTRDLTTV